MLRFLMIGVFRWREDAYASTCYLTDTAGVQGQCEYMFDSFECLCEDLAARRVAVHTKLGRSHDKQGAWGSSKDRRNALDLSDSDFDGLLLTAHAVVEGKETSLVRIFLEAGKNVLLVLPEGMEMFRSNEPRKQDAAKFLQAIGVDPQFALSGGRQRYKKLDAFKGVLHLATEDVISDWAYYDNYGRNRENDDRLDVLCEGLPKHRSPHLLIESQLPKAWPCGQEFTAEYSVKNCTTESVKLTLLASPREDFELFSSPDVSLSLDSGEVTLVSYLVHPKVVGAYSEVLSFGAGGGERLIVRGEGITIRQALLHVLRMQSPHDTQELKRLADVAVRLPTPRLEEDVAKVLALLSSDPESALNRVRKITEKLCKSVIGTGASGSLNDMILTLKNCGLMSHRAVSYLHTIRTIANLASHDSGKELTGEDVRIVAYALALVIEEWLDKGGKKA